MHIHCLLAHVSTTIEALKTAPWDSHGKQALGATADTTATTAQIWDLSAATAKAFTTVLAAFAFTLTSLPKMFLIPALVAGLTRVLILQRPGIVKMPVFFTSAVAKVAKLSRSSEHAFVFISCFSAKVAQIAPLDMALAPDFMDFMAFFMAMVAAGKTD